jgi:hypothetical protein
LTETRTFIGIRGRPWKRGDYSATATLAALNAGRIGRFTATIGSRRRPGTAGQGGSVAPARAGEGFRDADREVGGKAARDVVRDEDQRDLAPERVHGTRDVLGGGRIEARRRLVEDEDLLPTRAIG